jgi:5-methylcytosine-specific restriction endonuclease McrA
MTLICHICNNTFDVPPSKGAKRHTCSRKCGNEYKKLTPNSGQFQKGHTCSNTGRTHFKLGDKPSKETLEKARYTYNKLYKGKPRPDKQGENCYRWKGGITPINHAIRTSVQFKSWRDQVFQRDNYTCQDCGCHNGDGKTHVLHAHHKKPFATHPELRFELSNGLTLCVDCHKKTFTKQREKKPCLTT